jgi:hypothetical protein
MHQVKLIVAFIVLFEQCMGMNLVQESFSQDQQSQLQSLRSECSVMETYELIDQISSAQNISDLCNRIGSAFDSTIKTWDAIKSKRAQKDIYDSDIRDQISSEGRCCFIKLSDACKSILDKLKNAAETDENVNALLVRLKEWNILK